MLIALDATYSIGSNLSGVGVYSRELLRTLTATHPNDRFRFAYRPHRFLRAMKEALPPNAGRALLGETRMVPGRCDVFHALNQRMPEFRTRRSVCTFHDLFVMTSDAYSSADFRARFTQQARDAAERADIVIAVSAFTASQVESLVGVERARLRVVHHGVQPFQLTPARQPMILHTGTLQHRKNTVRLVNAFEALPPEWKLVLAGAADGYGAVELLAAIEASPARPRIEITGYVSRQELEDLYARASIFAFPSLDEGFGMPVLEAMSAGVPVVTSNRSALPEVCADAALLVDPCNTDAIAEALLSMAKSTELRDTYAALGKTRAAAFTWRRAADETWAIYRELV